MNVTKIRRALKLIKYVNVTYLINIPIKETDGEKNLEKSFNNIVEMFSMYSTLP